MKTVLGRLRWLGLGWHWLWLVPLCVVVLWVVEGHTLTYAFAILRLGWRRWTWGGLLSPSTGFCLIVMLASVIWPVLGLGGIAALITAKQRWYYFLLLIVGIFLIPFITDALMWGSFPFIFDDAGVARLRMIPFLPWPSGHYGEL